MTILGCPRIPGFDHDLSVDSNLETMVWRSEDQDTFGIEPDLVGTKVFDESTMPYRLFDAAHEGKNIGKKLKSLIETNGFVAKLGKRNRLHLTLLIQTEVDQFHERENPTPNQWIDLVDSMLSHCQGNHENCGQLKRSGHISFSVNSVGIRQFYIFLRRVPL